MLCFVFSGALLVANVSVKKLTFVALTQVDLRLSLLMLKLNHFFGAYRRAKRELSPLFLVILVATSVLEWRDRGLLQ